MEEEIKNQKPRSGTTCRNKVKQYPHQSRGQLKNQKIHQDSMGDASHQPESSSGWSSEVIEPAIKSMNFREKRGTRMKQLIKGKHRKDQFWQKYQNYFGGDLDKPDNSEDLEQYEASSSGRDQFDSDFDLTDSYVGKRGRKKGTKIKKRKRPVAKPQQDEQEGEPKPKGKRGRKRKIPVEAIPQLKSEILLKEGKWEIDLKLDRVFDGIRQQKAESIVEEVKQTRKQSVLELAPESQERIVGNEVSQQCCEKRDAEVEMHKEVAVVIDRQVEEKNE